MDTKKRNFINGKFGESHDSLNIFTYVDELFDQDIAATAALEELSRLCEIDKSLRNNVDFLWRFAKACLLQANSLEKKNPRRKMLLFEGRTYATKAYNLDENNFDSLKWNAILVGAMTEYLGVKEKISQGRLFKILLDKAIAIDCADFVLLHLRGRFAFSCASLTWIERKVCSAIYGKPPEGGLDEALEYFLQAEKVSPIMWGENLAYVARCYVMLGKLELADKYVKMLDELEDKDDATNELLAEVKTCLDKCK